MGTTGVLRHLTVTGILVFFIHNQIIVDAATTGRRPAPVSSATSTTNKGRRVMVEAFENAGKTPGLEIWRIEVKKIYIYTVFIYPFLNSVVVTSRNSDYTIFFVGEPNFMVARNIFSKTVKQIYLCFEVNHCATKWNLYESFLIPYVLTNS